MFVYELKSLIFRDLEVVAAVNVDAQKTHRHTFKDHGVVTLYQ